MNIQCVRCGWWYNPDASSEDCPHYPLPEASVEGKGVDEAEPDSFDSGEHKRRA